MLRLEAERFGDGRVLRGDARRRAAARPPAAGLVRIGLRARRSRSCSSTRRRSATCTSGSGDRLAGRASAGSRTALSASSSRSASRSYRYHRLRFPDAWSYPGALLNSIATAFIDEVTFRGALLGLLLAGRARTRRSRTSSRRSSTRSRRGSARRAATATCSLLTLGIGLLGGWLTVADRRDRGGVPRPRHHPLRGLPVHRPHRPDQAARPRGRGDREAPPTARGLAGHRVAGVGLVASG